MFICKFSIYKSISIMPLCKRVGAFELNSRMNIIEIIDEHFQTILSHSSDHLNIIDISLPFVRFPRSISPLIKFSAYYAYTKVSLPSSFAAVIACTFLPF